MKEIGLRIKSARMQLGYSRKKFSQKYDFSSATLQAWEDGKYTAPLKGIVKYVNALNDAGLISSVDWFLHGIGLSPRHKEGIVGSSLGNNSSILHASLNKQFISENTDFFEQSNQNSILISINDDTMRPFFNPGDFVGGYFITKEIVDQHIGSFCIVIIDTGEILVRKLKYGSKAGCFTLVSTNLDSEVDTAFLTNCEIQKIAPVTWHRKAYSGSV